MTTRSIVDDDVIGSLKGRGLGARAHSEYERGDTDVSQPPKPSPLVAGGGDSSEELDDADFADGDAREADEPSQQAALDRASEPPFRISNSDRPPAANGSGNGSAVYASQAAYPGAPPASSRRGAAACRHSSHGGPSLSALSSASAPALRGAPEGGSTAHSVAQGVEVERLRRELQAAEEKAQAAEKRVASEEQRASGAEKALDAAKRTGGVSSRELLDLREQLNRKERELLDLREQVTARDKQLIEASEHGLGRESLQTRATSCSIARETQEERCRQRATSTRMLRAPRRRKGTARSRGSEGAGRRRLNQARHRASGQCAQQVRRCPRRSCARTSARSPPEPRHATPGEPKSSRPAAREARARAATCCRDQGRHASAMRP